MADQTLEAQQFAESLARANAEMERYGKLTQQTQNDVTDANMKARFGLNNFTQATTTGAEAVISLAKAAIVFGKAMAEGKRGASASNGALDELSNAATLAGTALALLVPGGIIVKGVIAGLTLLTRASIEAAKMANEMTDKLHKGYQELSEAGGAAADGMSGLFEDAKKLGLALNDVGQYTALVTANAKDLALFSGTVFQGRQTFANVVKGMDQFKMGLMNTGLTQEQINAGAMGYLKLQSRIGQSQTQTTKQLAAGANKYLLEMDALSKITGETRKGMEDTMEAARSEERFAAKLQQLRASGRAEEAKQLELTNVMLASQSKEAAQGFRDLSTGMITTDAAQKLYLSTQGKALEETDKLSKGLTTAAGATGVIATAAGETATKLTELGKMGVFGETFINYSESLKLGIFAQNDLVKAQKKAEEQTDKQVAGADALVTKMSSLIISQQKMNESAERAILGMMDTSEDIMGHVSNAINELQGMIKKVFGYLAGAMGEFLGLKGGPGKELGSGGAKSPEGTLLASSAAATTQQAKAVKGVTRESEAIPASANQSVPPRPSDLMKAQIWDSRYGRGWNPDGTPKTTQQKTVAPAAAAAPAPAPAPASVAAVAVAAAAPPAPATTRSIASPAAASGGVGFSGSVKENERSTFESDTGKKQSTGTPAPTKSSSGGAGSPDMDAIRQGIIAHEGAYRYPYKDTLGLWTIGVGHLIGDGKTLPSEYAAYKDNGPAIGPKSVTDKNNKTPAISEQEMYAMLDKDIASHAAGAEQNTKNFKDMTSAGKNAFIDLAFNMGPAWNKSPKWPSLNKALDAKDSAGVAESLMNSKWYTQVSKRGQQVVGLAAQAFARDGGVFDGPSSGYPATLHGTEAVIPLKNGAVPVSLNASEVFSSLNNEIENIVKDIAEQSATNNEATVKLVADEFKSALSQMNKTKTDQSNSGMTEMLSMLSELVAAAKSGNDIQSKILRSAN